MNWQLTDPSNPGVAYAAVGAAWVLSLRYPDICVCWKDGVFTPSLGSFREAVDMVKAGRIESIYTSLTLRSSGDSPINPIIEADGVYTIELEKSPTGWYRKFDDWLECVVTSVDAEHVYVIQATKPFFLHHSVSGKKAKGKIDYAYKFEPFRLVLDEGSINLDWFCQDSEKRWDGNTANDKKDSGASKLRTWGARQLRARELFEQCLVRFDDPDAKVAYMDLGQKKSIKRLFRFDARLPPLSTALGMPVENSDVLAAVSPVIDGMAFIGIQIAGFRNKMFSGHYTIPLESIPASVQYELMRGEDVDLVPTMRYSFTPINETKYEKYFPFAKRIA